MKIIKYLKNKIYMEMLKSKCLTDIIVDKIDITLNNLTEYNYYKINFRIILFK